MIKTILTVSITTLSILSVLSCVSCNKNDDGTNSNPTPSTNTSTRTETEELDFMRTKATSVTQNSKGYWEADLGIGIVKTYYQTNSNIF